MGARITLSLTIAFMGALCTQTLQAQESETGSKLNTNLCMGLNVPLNPTAQIVGSSLNVVVGAGYNINRHHSFVGQFMWAGLPVNRETFRPIDLIANTRDISASSNLFAVTANYRYRLQGRTFGW